MKKLCLSLAILFAFALGGVAQQNNCWDGTIAESYSSGDGTAANPYMIATPQQLALLAQQTNNGTGGDAYYILKGDLCIDANWTPIGCLTDNGAACFTGHFNGNGKTISKVYYTPDGSVMDGVVGLFGCTNGAEIVNVNLSECQLNGTAYVGGLVGYAGFTEISGCNIGQSTVACPNGRAGGLVGNMGRPYGFADAPGYTESCHISHCRAAADVAVSGMRAGGIVCETNVEFSDVHCEISNCVNYGSVLCTEGGAGGIGGWLICAEVSDCVNHGPITGRTWSYTGGVVGFFCRAGMENCYNDGTVHSRQISGGVIGGLHNLWYWMEQLDTVYIINNCHNYGEVSSEHNYYEADAVAGGVIGLLNSINHHMNYFVANCSNHGNVVVEHGVAGGVLGDTRNGYVRLVNVYNVARISADVDLGGIVTNLFSDDIGGHGVIPIIAINTYNAGELVGGQETLGGIINWKDSIDIAVDCYWLSNEGYSGSSSMSPMPESCAFNATELPTQWELDSVHYGTRDLLAALNAGVDAIEAEYPEIVALKRWREDTEMQNGGFPLFEGQHQTLFPCLGTDWYYEIQNENGSVTYQHLEYAADSTINHKDVKIIIRTNTLYDKDEHQEVTHEYVYQSNNRVYWWNKTLGEFTLLYDFGANEGDSWVLKVGTESLTMHVESVSEFVYDETSYKAMEVSDDAHLFSGTIVCSIGHLSSFFPERLMNRSRDYDVDGLRCFWIDDELVFRIGDEDCDALYEEWYGVEEDGPSTGSGTFAVYPNPTHSVLFVETVCTPSLPDQTYHITNLMGQTVLTGNITAENKQIDVSNLPQGMYFISVGEGTRKFVVW